MKTETSSLPDKVRHLQVGFVRRINDTHIFLEQATSLLREAQEQLDTATKGDKKYYVPSISEEKKPKKKFANRTDAELKEIYDRFLSRALYENLIVTVVSLFESFLFDVLRLIISAYPDKLKSNVDGKEVKREFSLDILLNVSTREEAIGQIIEQQLIGISYAKPKVYLKYLKNIAGVATGDPAFKDYIEIKATRDLITHNLGIINNMYIEKVADIDGTTRGVINDQIRIDAEYFSHCIATLKRISVIINRNVKITFGQKSKKRE
jgi:hypothetical protein